MYIILYIILALFMQSYAILTKKELHQLKDLEDYCLLTKKNELKNKILTQFLSEHINELYTLIVNQAKVGRTNLAYKVCNTIYFTYYSHMSPIIKYTDERYNFSHEIFNIFMQNISMQLQYTFPDTDIQIEQKNECIYFDLSW